MLPPKHTTIAAVLHTVRTSNEACCIVACQQVFEELQVASCSSLGAAHRDLAHCCRQGAKGEAAACTLAAGAAATTSCYMQKWAGWPAAGVHDARGEFQVARKVKSTGSTCRTTGIVGSSDLVRYQLQDSCTRACTVPVRYWGTARVVPVRNRYCTGTSNWSTAVAS